MDQNKRNEIVAIVLLAIAVLTLISLITFDVDDLPFFTSHVNHPLKNFAGLVGAYVGGLFFIVMGFSSFVIPLLILSWATARFWGVTPQKVYFKVAGTAFLIVASSALFSIVAGADSTARFRLGGVIGLAFSDFLVKYLGFFGAIVVILVLFLLSVLLATEFLLLPFLTKSYKSSKELISKVKEKIGDGTEKATMVTKKRSDERTGAAPERRSTRIIDLGKNEPQKKWAPKRPLPSEPEKSDAPVRVAPPLREEKGAAPKTQSPAAKDGGEERGGPTKEAPQSGGEYLLPAVDLLATVPPIADRTIQDDFDAIARILEETLGDFDIEAKVVGYTKGPAITRYELEPASGVKIQRVTSLSDNIALAMKAQSVRIVAPIPGKGTIGVEVPNSSSTIVYFRELIDSNEFRSFKSPLKLALGKDIAGAPVLADLGGMPHLLIAGATGSGKTVCVNSIIMSLLYTCSPAELKFLMIDPKRVELAVYNGLPHLLSPVVTDAKKVSSALDWIVGEMDSRYETFAHAGVRNIDLYNEKVSLDGASRMPYIIVIIDELADLMMVAQQDIESAITRLAQLSRAVGIHMIIATQRPSVDVITGVIKANFPARISFKVASKVDSRTVLDMNGADKLLGRGDMLFVEPGASRPVRAQGCLIKDAEIEKIVSFIKAQSEPQYVDGIMAAQKKTQFKKFVKDEVYEQAVRVVLELRQASVSILQRRLGLGYTRAARLVDMMEDEGIVGPYQGAKPRDILIASLDERKEPEEEDV